MSLTREDKNGVAWLTLDKPDTHNAFDDTLIAGLTGHLKQIADSDKVRAVVLTGRGKSFSAGADLNWMRRMADADEAENKADSLRLAELMRTLNFLPKPTIARVNGATFGGGVGLVACCDIAIAHETARFALSEVKLGLVPAVISPYVVHAIGQRQARRLFQTAEAIDAQEAQRIGLVHQVTDDLDTAVEFQLGLLAKAGPQALRAAKQLAFAVLGHNEGAQQAIDESTAGLIARLRVSDEGQEGLTAFLDKRPPDWAGKPE